MEPCINCDGTGFVPPEENHGDAVCVQCQGTGKSHPDQDEPS